MSITNLIQFLRMLSLLFTVNPKPRKSTKYNIYCLCLCKKLVSGFRKEDSRVRRKLEVASNTLIACVSLFSTVFFQMLSQSQWNLTFLHCVLSMISQIQWNLCPGQTVSQLFPNKIDFCIFTIGIYENASFPNNVEETFAKNYFEIRIDN